MRKRDESFLTVLNGVFVSAPWWIGPIVVALTYVVFSAVLPAVILSAFPVDTGTPSGNMNKTLVQVFAPLPAKLAPLTALIVLGVWVISLTQKQKRAAILRSSGDLRRMKEVSWEDFEVLVGDYYRLRGFGVQRRGGAKPDGGVDLELYKDGEITLVQCKHWKAFKVGVRQAREFFGVMTHEGARRGILVSSGEFTQEAREFAGQNGIDLLDGAEFSAMIRASQGTAQRGVGTSPAHLGQPSVTTGDKSPLCPKCGQLMVLRTARKGANVGSQFWGCPRYPACSGTRNL